MLKKILSPESCAECRLCCGFDKDDIWEIPLLEPALADYLGEEKNGGFKLIARDENYVFDMKFEENGLTYCPALTERGCSLGERKPFDCQIWPLRVMRLGEYLVITLSPICKAVPNRSVSEISDFVAGISDTIYNAAKNNPGMVKDYIDGYPIFAVRKDV